MTSNGRRSTRNDRMPHVISDREAAALFVKVGYVATRIGKLDNAAWLHMISENPAADLWTSSTEVSCHTCDYRGTFWPEAYDMSREACRECN